MSKWSRNRHWFTILLFAALAVMSCAAFPSEDQVIVTLPDGRRAILYDDFTWDYYEQIEYDFDFASLTSDSLPEFLRQGIKADIPTQTMAVEMYLQGWRYIMPRPKSAQARWGNYDGRTTWWYGYWMNESTDPVQVSRTTPLKRDNGLYYGDDLDVRNTYRTGGSPSRPTKLEWLLSIYGGIEPWD